ncbi:MAG TPA: hypothetical protein VK034_22560, partial [Enhygromyxa sp.]|nr:hypothetical protein [Enhygromyxa sp.]
MTCKRSGSRVLAAAIVLGASGCGAGAIAADGDDTSETDSGDGDGDPGDGDPGDGDPGDGDGDLPTDACIDDGQLARPLAIVNSTDRQVHVFEPGGAELILPAPLPGGVDASPILSAVAGPDHLAVTSSYSLYLGPGQLEQGSVLRLFDRHSGALLWEHGFDWQLGQAFVDEQGRVVTARGWSADMQPPAGLLVIDGELIDLPNFAPAGPLGADDWLPGWIVDDDGEYVGATLYQPFSGEWVEVLDSYGPPWRAGDQLIEYVDNQAAV